MTDWRDGVLGDVVELKRGYDLPKRSRTDGPFPIVSSSGISGSHAEAKVQGPGVVTGRYGTLGQVFYIKGDYWPLNTSLYVRDFKGNNPLFVAVLLESMDLSQHDGAAAVPGLNRNQLHTVAVSVPDRSGQDQIAWIVESLDDLIENTRHRVEVLEEMVRAIYREWFVHFRYPGWEDATFVESPLGPIPEGWKATESGELQGSGVLEVGDGYRAKNSEMTGGDDGLPFLRVANVREGWLSIETADRLPASYASSLKSKVSQSGDVVVSMKGTVGRQVMVRDRHPKLAYSPQVSYWRALDRRTLSPAFLYEWIRSSDFVDQCAAVKGGTAMADYVSLTDQRRMKMRLPPAALMEEFSEAVEPILDLAGVCQTEVGHLSNIRDLLLPKLVTGQIDVSSLDLDGLVEGPVT